MSYPTESKLLAQRLEAIQAERIAIKRRDEELSADEQRIRLALEVIRSVVAEYGSESEAQPTTLPSAHAALSLPGLALSATGSTTPAAPASFQSQPKQRLEDLILQAFDAKEGMTSLEVAGLLSHAKRESVMSTLSRMVSKGMVRREGKLYLRSVQGEGPEVVATTGPSIATESVPGQHTSSAPIDEEDDLT